MVITMIRAATPIVRPSTVKAARSLCERIESAAMLRFSVKAGMQLDSDPAPLLPDLDGMHGARGQGILGVDLLLAVNDDCAGFSFPRRVTHRLGESDVR